MENTKQESKDFAGVKGWNKGVGEHCERGEALFV